METRVLTVMFTDIKGFTERTSGHSREELSELLKAHDEILKPHFERFSGRVVKTLGDAFLVTFESPTNAVLCGLAIQDQLHKFNAELDAERRIEVRVAVSSGEVLLKENDIFGEAVNIAARLEGVTEAGEIYFTDSVYLAMNKQEVPTSEVGMRRFKGIPEPVKIYRVIQDENLDLYRRVIARVRNMPPPGPARDGSTGAAPGSAVSGSRKTLPAIVLALASISVVALWFTFSDESRSPTPVDVPGDAPATGLVVPQASDALQREVALARTAFETESAQDGLEAFKALLDAHPDDPDVLFQSARAIMDHAGPSVFGAWPEVAFPLYLKAFVRRPGLAREPVVRLHLLEGFRIASPVQSGDADEKMRRIAMDHWLEELRPELVAGLSDAGKWYFRVNCYLTLEAAGEIDALDTWSFHALNLEQHVAHGFASRAVDFFAGIREPARRAEALAILERVAADPALSTRSALLQKVEAGIAELKGSG